MHSSILAAPMAPSLQNWWSAKISPPFSSPPNTAPSDAISRATTGDPTAVYTVRPPTVPAVSSTTREVATVTTTPPPRPLRRYLLRMASARSPGTYLPDDVANTTLSASPSWAMPISALVSLTVSRSSCRLSSVGSLRWPGRLMSDSPLMTMVETPSLSRSIGDVTQEHPFAQSSTALMPALLMASASTFDTTESIYSSAAPSTCVSVPISCHPTVSGPARYAASISSSCPFVHSVPSPAMHLMPLNSGGLWDAVIMTPPSTSPRALIQCCSAGVGTMPRSRTSAPTDMSPEHSAPFSMGDDVRGSHAIAIRLPRTVPTARPIPSASSQSISRSAIPRTPLVPNILVPMAGQSLPRLKYTRAHKLGALNIRRVIASAWQPTRYALPAGRG